MTDEQFAALTSAIADVHRTTDENARQLADLRGRVQGLQIAVKHWADETLALRESYREARREVSGLGDRVARLERQTQPTIDESVRPANGGT